MTMIPIKCDEFYILLESLSIEEYKNVKDFRDVNTIAGIPNENDKLDKLKKDKKHKDLMDLIPPDLDMFGLNVDTLMLSEIHGDSDDYVSLFSSEDDSDDSFYNCEESESNISSKTMPKELNGRPGVKLDINVLGPPKKDKIDTLPLSTVHKCQRERCGYTTSNPWHYKMHRC